MRRFFMVGIAVTAMLTAIASPAAAMRPDRFTPGPNPDLQVDDICSFPVLLHDVANKVHITDFYDRHGDLVRESGNGKIVEDITRLDASGDPVRTIRRNISGPGTFTFDEDGFTLRARGVWLFFFEPGEVSNVPGRAHVAHHREVRVALRRRVRTVDAGAGQGNPDGCVRVARLAGAAQELGGPGMGVVPGSPGNGCGGAADAPEEWSQMRLRCSWM